MKPEDQIDELIDRLMADVLRASDSATKDVVKALNAYLSTFPLEDGKFITGDRAVGYVARIEQVMADAIQASKYPASVAGIIRSMPEIERLSVDVLNAYNPKIGGVDFDRLGVSQLRQAQIETITQNMTQSGLTAEIREPIRQALQRNVYTGATLTDTKKFIAEYLGKGDNKYARLTRYAGVWAQDGIMQYDGMIYDSFRREYKPNKIMYIGSLLLNDSRPQCIRWINKYNGVIPIEKLQSEINWAYSQGSGMNLATTASNFCTYRGGYRCRHKAIPVFEDDEDVD